MFLVLCPSYPIAACNCDCNLVVVPYVGPTGSLLLCLLALSLRSSSVSVVPRRLHGFLVVNACLQAGKTPLHVAARMGQFEVARLLLRYGAEVDAKDGVSRDGWLHPWSRTGIGSNKQSCMAFSFLV